MLAFTRYLLTFNAFVNEPTIISLSPPARKAHTVAIVLRDYCARYTPPPTLRVYAIHHTILVIAISCEGQTICHTASISTPHRLRVLVIATTMIRNRACLR